MSMIRGKIHLEREIIVKNIDLSSGESPFSYVKNDDGVWTSAEGNQVEPGSFTDFLGFRATANEEDNLSVSVAI